MKLDTNSALIIIDAQEGIKEESHWGGNRNNPHAETNIALLLNLWRKNNLPTVIVQHCSTSQRSPFRPEHAGNALMGFVQMAPGEKLIRKSTANAFIKTDLLQFLEHKNITSIIITGFVTNNSVESTARYSGDYGFRTIVVEDATACFDKIGLDAKKYPADLVHQLSLANLKDEYALITTTTEIVAAINKHFHNTKS